MNKLKYSLLLFGVVILSSCRDYVEINAVGERTLKYTDDYQYLLNNDNTMNKAYYSIELASDDVEAKDSSFQVNMAEKYALAYKWADYIYSDPSEEDPDWESLYSEIYVCNQVTSGVLSSEDGTDDTKKNIYAQAQVHRAFAYYDLVNVFAKQYDSSTASTDNGVPLLLTPDLYASLKRASVQAVYDQIIKDLKEAAQILPIKQSNRAIASKLAAYGMLARTYLQMGNYDEASLYADSVLQKQDTLIDLNNYAKSTVGYPNKMSNPEIVFYKRLSNSNPSLPLSDNLISLLGVKDLRYQLYTAAGSNFYPSFSATDRGYYGNRLSTDGVVTGPCVPEMMLIKAESSARNGNYQDAVAILNTLRKKRFIPSDYEDLTASNKEEALKLVLDERRRELFGRGYRWFDQKRLNKESAYAETVTRVFKGVTYTLLPNDNHYVYAIAEKYIELNPEIEQNPR